MKYIHSAHTHDTLSQTWYLSPFYTCSGGVHYIVAATVPWQDMTHCCVLGRERAAATDLMATWSCSTATMQDTLHGLHSCLGPRKEREREREREVTHTQASQLECFPYSPKHPPLNSSTLVHFPTYYKLCWSIAVACKDQWFLTIILVWVHAGKYWQQKIHG